MLEKSKKGGKRKQISVTKFILCKYIIIKLRHGKAKT